MPSKSLRNAVIRAFPGLFRILRMCAPRRAAAVVRPRGREKSADRRRRILISRLLIIRASVPRWKSPFPAYFKGFPAVSPLIPPYPAFLKYPVSPHSPDYVNQRGIRVGCSEAELKEKYPETGDSALCYYPPEPTHSDFSTFYISITHSSTFEVHATYSMSAEHNGSVSDMSFFAY